MSVFKTALCVCLLIPSLAFAQVDEARVWSGELRLGAAKSTGNTDLQRFNGMISVQRNQDPWRHNLRLDGLYARSNGEERARRYSVSAQTDFKVRPRDYAFHKARYEENKFNAFDYNITTSAGYGRRLLQTQSQQLDVEVGVGYRQSQRTLTGEVEGDPYLDLTANYRWQIQPGSILTHQMSAEINEERTVARSQTKLGVRVNSRVNLSLGYDVRYNSDVAPHRENVDTETTVNMGYRF